MLLSPKEDDAECPVYGSCSDDRTVSDTNRMSVCLRIIYMVMYPVSAALSV
jgi:hypothetical protein